MPGSNHLAELLGLGFPLIQAPMAGGLTPPGLVAAVSEAGGLGSLGAGYQSPEQIRQAIHQVRALTARPFAVSLFIPTPFEVSSEALARAQELLRPYRRELGLPEAALPERFTEDFERQVEVILQEAPRVFSFTFGIPSAEVLAECRKRGILTVGTATTVEEGLALEAAGVDGVCAQGTEAGGHRGTFLGPAENALMGTMALVPQLVDRLRRPVIAAGGIMDGRGIAAALALGAQAVQLGTAFLSCPEAGTAPAWRQVLLGEAAGNTRLTRAFSGRAARGIENRFLVEMAAHEAELPPYPVQNALTRELRQKAAQQGRSEYLSLWAGQAARMSRPLPVRELVETLKAETREAIQRLHRLG